MLHSIFVAATGQNVGKSTTCLGILSGLQKRFSSVGFLKPIGQNHKTVEKDLKVDKDVVLFKEYFHLKDHYADMSPVLIPPGFTRDYLDGTVSHDHLKTRIQEAHDAIAAANPFLLIEGTGHVGVGSIIDFHNAAVAKQLKAEMIIIVSGGLGSAIDELSLNISLCEQAGVKVRGVILNKVLETKREMLLEYFPKALKKWGIPLLGAIPYNAFLSTPTMKDFEVLFKQPLLSGESYHLRHFKDIRLASGSLDSFQKEFTCGELIITSATREDLILATLERYAAAPLEEQLGGMILTGTRQPSSAILEKIRKQELPILYVPTQNYQVLKQLTSFIAKTEQDDIVKVNRAIALVEPHLNFDLMLG